MKIFKRILVALLVLIFAGGVGGYFHFKNKFMGARPSTLTISNPGDSVPFIWRGMDINGTYEPNIAMYVPVHLPGIDRTFYMQFDTGAPSTVMYYEAVRAINEKYGNVFDLDTTDGVVHVSDAEFNVGTTKVKAAEVHFRGKLNTVNLADTNAIIKIGSIGSDFIENHTLIMDFKTNQLALKESMPKALESSAQFLPLTFEGRKVFLSAELNEEPASLWYDSGSSAFELIVEEKTFEKLAAPGAERNTFEGSSWGNGITVHNIKSDGAFKFGDVEVPLTYATYMEWPNKLQALIIKLSNLGGDLGGMTGNKLFLDKVLVLDASNLRYVVVE